MLCYHWEVQPHVEVVVVLLCLVVERHMMTLAEKQSKDPNLFSRVWELVHQQKGQPVFVLVVE